MYPPFTWISFARLQCHWHTFLNLFLNICFLTREVPIASSCNRFQSVKVILQRRIFQHLFLFSWILFSNSDQLYSGSMASVTCHYIFPHPFTVIRFVESTHPCCPPTQSQGFSDWAFRTMGKFSSFILYSAFPVWIPAGRPVFKNRT
jgi:hypothetical protein